MGCCNRKLLISESEKKHILSLYGLINEADEPVAPQSQTTTSALKFDKSVNFAPGYYRLKGPVTTKAGVTYNWDVDQTLNSDLEKIKDYESQVGSLGANREIITSGLNIDDIYFLIYVHPYTIEK